MTLLFILSAIAVVLAVLYGIREKEIGLGCGFGIVGIMLSIMVTLVSYMIVDSVANHEYYKAYEQKIIALQDGDSTKGRFFLGSGYIDGDMKYVYMTSSNGEMQMSTVTVQDATLIYSNDAVKIEKYEAFYTNKLVIFLFGEEAWQDYDKYKIYVPEGTVKQGFNVDLQG